MTPESWSLMAILLLALAALTRGMAISGMRGPWTLVVTCSRVAAAAALALALAQLVGIRGGWSPLDWKQLMMSLSLAILVFYQAMAWGFRFEGGSPFVDLLALALVVTGTLITEPGSSSPTCLQSAVPFYVQWILFLVGAAAAAIMGSTGFLLGLWAGLGHRSQRAAWPDQADLMFFLAQSTMLTLVALGSGLILSICWTWQMTGNLSNSDPHVTWVAITWLLAAMSSQARLLERHQVGWLTGLAVATAASALFGLLTIAHLPTLF